MIRYLVHILVCSMLFIACHKSERQDSVSSSKVEIQLQDSIAYAGSVIQLTLIAEKQGSGDLLFTGAWGTKAKAITLDKGQNHLTLPETWTKWSGKASLRFVIGSAISEPAKLTILPQSAVDPMEVYTGPKTIWNNRKQSSMIVSVPRDSMDNIVDPETILDQQFKYPEGVQFSHKAPTKHLIGATEFMSFKSSGDIFIGSSGKGTHAGEQKVEVVPSWPAELVIEIVDHVPYADNRHFAAVRTKPLVDEIGNQIPDGTLVQFNISTQEGSYSMYRAYTIDGVASTMIKNPSYSTLWKVNASIGNVLSSNTIKLFFDSPLKAIKYTFDREKNQLTVGPLVSYLGQYISDGTVVYASFNDVFKQKGTESGFAVFDLDKLGLDKAMIDLKILVADKEIKAKINLSNE